MIQVVIAKEPSSFDADVRQKGLSAIDRMVGKKPRLASYAGRQKKIATREQDIPPSKFPAYWRDALPDLLNAYDRRCAFLALYLEHATGNPSVDHMLPKSKNWKEVYEWDNYRLCAASINARKNDMTGLVDPVDCRGDWFALDLIGFQVIRGSKAPSAQASAINATLDIVNAPNCCKAREEYVTNYLAGDITLDYLERRAPFIAQELRRQGRLRASDK